MGAQEYVFYKEKFDLSTLDLPTNEEIWQMVQVNVAIEEEED
jgi:hypothetical protein